MASDPPQSEFKAPPPPRPATPERPLSAIEHIPEAAFAIAELLKREPTHHHRRPTTRKAPPKVLIEKRNTKGSSSRGHRHAHSNSASFAVPPASPIDTLASVAAYEATSRSPPTFHNLYQSQYPFERASKRARSEIAPSPQQPATSPLFDHGTATRPATSYNYNGWGYNVEQGINQGQRIRSYSTHTRTGSINGAYPESNVDEAELLLNFSRGGGTSSSHGLGISAPSAAPAQRTPVLPPFPFTPGGQAATSALPQSPTSPTQPAPPHSPISPPANLSIPAVTRDAESSQSQARSIANDLAQQLHAGDRMDLDSVETKAEPIDSTMTDAPPAPNVDEQSHEVPGNTRLKTVPDQLAKLPSALHVPDVDGRRYSDSHQDNPLKHVRLASSRRSSSVPLEYAMSESTEPSVAMDSQNAEDASKVPEQDVICPACKNATEVAADKVNWLQCDGCSQWYHFTCSGLTAKQSKAIDKYYCETCEPKFGKSTKKRTSTRPRNAVNYAGLNEGVLRGPTDSREHHYIERFKTNDFDLTPETFPRIPGKEITADFFEKCASFNEPVLIPNHLNPRPAFPGTTAREELGADDNRMRVPDEGQDDMDMVIPQGLTVRRVAQHYGPKNQIPVIDVKAQESSKGWTVEKWADYYENPGDEPIRNVISLECSQTPLWRLIRRPKVVRELDLQDSVWPDNELRRSVGFYVLMSVADSYTDFHIDFGGSSVYYHILKGKKVFFFIPPTPANLRKYQDWNDMESQTSTWLPSITKTKECYRVDLYPGDTMLIPAGWIHAVWTPDDSLVIGGNFLTRLHYGMQFRVADIEKANKTPITFRYPKFQKVMWYAVLQYLERDPLPAAVRSTFLDGHQFKRDTPIWSEFDKFGENSDKGAENFNARYYPKAELDDLPELCSRIFRTVMISMDRVENISAKVRKSVVDSIPKLPNNREPLDIAREFAMWVAWKRGNEDVPEWAHPGAVLPNKAEDASDGKKLTEAQMKKMQKASAISLPERQSARLKSVAETAAAIMPPEQQMSTPVQMASTPKTSSLGPRRTACDSCRRRKMRCKHVESVPSHSSPIIFTNPMESTPQSNFMGVVVPENGTPSHPPAAAFPPPFQVDPLTPMQNGMEMQGFSSGPKQELTELKKGRTKACYDCRRSKRRCIHDEFGKVDPIKQREPVVPRGSAKRKSGPGPEMPLAKKPANEQIAPVAPMMAGQVNTFDSVSPPAPAPFVQTKQDGMFRNSTVNDFSSMTGVVNINPLASRNAQPARQPVTNGHHQSPPQPQPNGWDIDPALMDPELSGPPSVGQPEGDDATYNDAEAALLQYGYYQSNGVPQSSQEAANQFMNGFVDYEGGRPGTAKGEQDMDIDPALQDAIAGLRAAVQEEKAQDHPVTKGVSKIEQPPFDPALDPALADAQPGDHEQTNGIAPSTEPSLADDAVSQNGVAAEQPATKARPQTPQLEGSAVKSVSPEALRTTPGKTPMTNGKRTESSVTIEDADPETMKLIEQMRQENLQSKGLRRRS